MKGKEYIQELEKDINWREKYQLQQKVTSLLIQIIELKDVKIKELEEIISIYKEG